MVDASRGQGAATTAGGAPATAPFSSRAAVKKCPNAPVAACSFAIDCEIENPVAELRPGVLPSGLSQQ